MATYKSPGVYVEELSTLPPSVAAVATAVPAFIGYTEKLPVDGSAVKVISSILEYKEAFGGAQPAEYEYTITDGEISSIAQGALGFKYNMYYNLQMFFKNGGGKCYVISAGVYPEVPAKAHFETGLTLLEKEDEPTLIVLTDALTLKTADYYDLSQQALNQCAKLKDRFAIIDVPDSEDDTKFREGLTQNLKYGAAYTPYLQTSITYDYDPAKIKVKGIGVAEKEAEITLANIENTNTDAFNKIKQSLAAQRVTLPPCGAVAGVYAMVDNNRGVWKAPANEGVAGVIAPSKKITNAEQDLLNIDADSGKSINVIRSFAGKGTLVWGARTLAGNDNEWRYVPVRRLFIMIEEAIQKASAFAVFEPNTATTWLKVKAMIDSYLYGLWQKGAFSGSTSEEAYFVNVGLGTTMTEQDVLEGRMNIEIGVAAARPAEFIILKFSHHLQQS